MIQPGTIILGRYEIIKQIGSGGMALVYQAKCHKLNRYVAIKVLRQEFNEDEEFLKRFVAEAQATAGLVHPNIVTIYDAGEEQGCHYIVMELCEGTTLKRYIRRYGRLSVRETVDFAMQIARGIQAAHRMGIVHRDIKPQNILVSESGRVKVTDFGIAKAATGDTNIPGNMGSVHYLSPEQARGRYADARSDIYSLGITMYEMATGKVPFDGENSVTVALKHLQDEIVPPTSYFPDIPSSLEKIILKCTMKHTSQRYQNAQELLNDLEKVFSCPDGAYVFAADENDADASPTIHRTKEEIDQINQMDEQQATGQIPSLKGSAEQNDRRAKKEMFQYPKNEPKNDAKKVPKNGGKKGSKPEVEEEDEEDSMQPQMKKVVILITAAAAILLTMFIVITVFSGIRRLRPSKEDISQNTTEAKGTSEEALQEMIVMPNVLKQSEDEARRILITNNLKAKWKYVEDANMDERSTFVVVEQEFAQGTSLEKGTTVTLTLGPDPEATTEAKRVEVPLLLNESKKSAKKLLKEAGLEVKFIYADSDSIKKDYVIKQSPTAGVEVDRGFTITVTVSNGVSQAKVPPLTGLTKERAKKLLNDIGLELGAVTSDYSGAVAVGEVFEQGIEAGTMVDRGTEVSVVISLGEHTSYHYEGQITITDSPFMEDEAGSVKLVLHDGNKKKTIYSNSGLTADDFPLHYTFTGSKEGRATVVLYVNGEEYEEYEVNIKAVAD